MDPQKKKAQMLNLNGIRLLACLILFTLTLLFGILPVHLFEWISKLIKKNQRRKANNQKHQTTESTQSLETCTKIQLEKKKRKWINYDSMVQCLTQLGGGVLFYTAFIHMLPEIRENYDQYKKNTTPNEDSNFLLVDMFACIGFFGMFLIEELMHLFTAKNHHNFQEKKTETERESFSKRQLSIRQCKSLMSNYTLQIDEKDSNSGQLFPPRLENISKLHSTNSKVDSSRLEAFSETHPIPMQQASCYNTCGQLTCTESHKHQEDDAANKDTSFSLTAATAAKNEHSTHSIWPVLVDNFMLIMAFSCHAIFDGISIGVQMNEDDIWTMLIAILSHKLIIAFMLSFQLLKRCKRLVVTIDGNSTSLPIRNSKVILCFFSTLFALMSPLGILLVVAMNRGIDETNLDIIILSSISAGTILYIVFLEIIDKSSTRLHLNGLVQLVTLVLGFLSMHFITELFHE